MGAAPVGGFGKVTHLKPMLMGRNPLHREALVQDLWKKQRACGVRAIGAVDVALWDLLGKSMGQPIHRLLGTYRESVPAYASSAVMSSPTEYAEEAMRFKEGGWAAYKIHPPTDPDTDIKVCEAVRRGVGEQAVGIAPFMRLAMQQRDRLGMLARARQMPDAAITYEVADVEQLALAEGAFDGLLADVAARVILTAREGRFDKAGRTITARLDGRGTLALTNCLDRLQQVMSWDLASDCTLRLQS